MKETIWPRLRCAAGLFCVGGGLYNIIEICWRGYTHWSMFVVGGLCFPIIGWIHTHLKKMHLINRCFLCSVAITAIEFISGCVVNLWLKMNVWDYSYLPMNLLGQICLIYSVLWGLLSIVAIPIYKYLCRLFGGASQKKPVIPSVIHDKQAS